ncbi:hybrid sensor histidine kinase/response regulator [Sulfurovum sp. NBC37-1]|uniref:hybrid sensor histidine kinase/response regulator n=1 Tax=Sulfurovum sp. (strain NBC37-1) TaxID=387093 RepID=UPI0001587DA0|nr:ATP-binding protein [Sulfurovum sp. NBC37-1]BAF72346.1 hypothetical protein SUN_1395 [Sulfurovum sp. NBC37-1]
MENKFFIDTLYKLIKQIFPTDRICISCLEKDTSGLLVIDPASYKKISVSLKEDSISKLCLGTEKPFIVNHLEDDFLYNPKIDNPFRHPDDSCALLPITYRGKHRISGLISIFKQKKSNKKTFFTKEEIEKALDFIEDFTKNDKKILDTIKNNAIKLQEFDLYPDRKSEFFSSVIHDIRTPMNAVLGFLDLLKEEVDPKQVEYVQSAHKSAEMVIALINDVLDFNKISSGKLKIDLYYFSPVKELENTALLFYHNALSKRIDFIIYVDPNIPYLIKSGPIRLKQIINNLISNAIKFTPEGGMVTLEMLYELDTDELIVNVKDTGIGIPEEAQKSIFHPFQQASKSIAGKYGGTGLGLSISKKLADLLEGELHFDSKEGEGTTFTLTIPCNSIPGTPKCIELDPEKIPYLYMVEGSKNKHRYSKNYSRYFDTLNIPYEVITADALVKRKINTNNSLFLGISFDFNNKNELSLMQKYKRSFILFQVEMFEDSSLIPDDLTILNMPIFPEKLFTSIDNIQKAPEPFEEKKMSKKHVLLVDDSVINLKLMEEVSRRLGAISFSARNGKEGIEMFKNNDIDIIFIDKNMPVLDGIESIKEIRKLPKGKDVTIYGLTGDSESEVHAEMIEAGADSILTKPIEISRIREILTD